MIIFNKDCIAVDVTAKMKIINVIIWMCFLSTKNIQCLVNLKYYVVYFLIQYLIFYLDSVTFIQFSNIILVNTVQSCFY